MSGYVKLFSGLLDSSVWGESKEVRLLWVTMLAKKDRFHVVRSSVPGLARAACLSVEETEEALKVLLGPDKWSRSREKGGRRLEEVEGGWLVVNGEKYKRMLSLEERKEYKRLKQAEYRRAGGTLEERLHVEKSKE